MSTIVDATLETNGSIRVWCARGVVFPGGTQEFGPDGQPTGYALFWPKLPPGTTLDGATNEPAPETRVANAGEFAAVWNTYTPEQREDMFIQIMHQRDTSIKCFQEDHQGLLAELSSLRTPAVTDERVNAAWLAWNGAVLAGGATGISAMRAALEAAGEY